MSTQADLDHVATAEEAYGGYRALCSAAITSLLLGLLSAMAFLSPFLIVIPVLGILVGAYAVVQIRDRSAELTGSTFAWIGIALSSVLLLASVLFMVVIYVTEVPEGHARIFYRQLQPEEGRLEQKYPPFAESIDGDQVFIKGYVFPGPQQHGIQTFLLVRDKGDCCFGGNPKITDRIQVTLGGAERLSFSPGLHKLAGTFRLAKDSQTAVNAGGQVLYFLDNAQLR